MWHLELEGWGYHGHFTYQIETKTEKKKITNTSIKKNSINHNRRES